MAEDTIAIIAEEQKAYNTSMHDAKFNNLEELEKYYHHVVNITFSLGCDLYNTFIKSK